MANEKKETLVRLMSYTPPVIQQGRRARRQPPPPKPKAFGEGAKYFEERKGFANYYFNRLERDRVLANAKKLADYSNAHRRLGRGPAPTTARIAAGDFLAQARRGQGPGRPEGHAPGRRSSSA